MEMITYLKGNVIVSVQAMPNEPLYNKVCMEAMMASVINGGAKSLRVAGARDVKIAKQFNVPIIGLTKPEKLPENWKEVVYITPTTKEVNELIDAGADIIAFDGTSRYRGCDCTVKDIIDLIHSKDRIAMADISTFEEGQNCAKLGADLISTTLSGYTVESDSNSQTPDYELLANLVNSVDKPVILEGRIWEPSQVKEAFQIGAHAVVIGSAITRPQLITKRFMEFE